MKVVEKYEICYPNPLNLKVGNKIQVDGDPPSTY